MAKILTFGYRTLNAPLVLTLKRSTFVIYFYVHAFLDLHMTAGLPLVVQINVTAKRLKSNSLLFLIERGCHFLACPHLTHTTTVPAARQGGRGEQATRGESSKTDTQAYPTISFKNSLISVAASPLHSPQRNPLSHKDGYEDEIYSPPSSHPWKSHPTCLAAHPQSSSARPFQHTANARPSQVRDVLAIYA